MKIITALGNEEINKKIRAKKEIDYQDIQYQEGVIDILEKDKKINLLILNSLLPGEFKIEEFINIIKYKNPDLKIIIILAEANERLKYFLIAKGIEDIYYNNKITIEEILEKINNMENTSENKQCEVISKNIKLKKNKSAKKHLCIIYELIKNKLIFILKKNFHKKNSNKLKFNNFNNSNNNKIIVNIKNNKIIIIINNK